MKTIFSNGRQSIPEKSENQKISYWLEKLYHQEQEKINNDVDNQKNVKSNQSLLANMTVEKKGLDEALKNKSKKEESDKNLVANMVNDSNQILVSISSMFPWDFFPQTLNIEATRVTIIHRQIFTSQVHSVDILDISNVFINTGFFYATLIVVSKTFGNNEIAISKLPKKKAIFARRIIEGLRMFTKSNIDTTKYSKDELIGKLKELSTTKIVL